MNHSGEDILTLSEKKLWHIKTHYTKVITKLAKGHDAGTQK